MNPNDLPRTDHGRTTILHRDSPIFVHIIILYTSVIDKKKADVTVIRQTTYGYCTGITHYRIVLGCGGMYSVAAGRWSSVKYLHFRRRQTGKRSLCVGVMEIDGTARRNRPAGSSAGPRENRWNKLIRV